MSKHLKEDDDPVSDKLCQARMQALVERIEGLKKTVVACCTTTTVIIVIVQFILTLIKG